MTATMAHVWGWLYFIFELHRLVLGLRHGSPLRALQPQEHFSQQSHWPVGALQMVQRITPILTSSFVTIPPPKPLLPPVRADGLVSSGARC